MIGQHLSRGSVIEIPLTMRGERHRWESLDALRGIAAFLVLTFHCCQVFPGFAARSNPLSLMAWLEPWSWFKYTPLRLFVSAGPPAVVLFFALSGFVLSLPFLCSKRRPSYLAYVIKRICRIYLPFAVAIIASVALYAITARELNPVLSQWFKTVLWDQPLSLEYVERNLMMTGITRDMTLDTVMWSLVHELRISLIFPVLFVLTRRWPTACVVASLLGSLLCTVMLGGVGATNLITSLMDTTRFLPLFVVGIVVAHNVPTLRTAVGRLPAPLAAVLWVGSVALMLVPGPTVTNYYDFIWGAGAVLLLMLTVGSLQAARVLAAIPLVWLGRVSYSLYLIHVPLLVATIHLTSTWLPPVVAVFTVIPLSLLCAGVMQRFIEEPSMRLGRRLASVLDLSARSLMTTTRPATRRSF